MVFVKTGWALYGKAVLVTGAGGYLGRYVVESLRRTGVHVRAGVHRLDDAGLFTGVRNVEPVEIDVLSRPSLLNALEGVDAVYHFAALNNSTVSKEDIFQVNVEGTRNVWKCAVARGVSRALYCSCAAVYGLMANAAQPVTEDTVSRAMEPYGRSKLIGESIASEISRTTNLKTIIIRPVGIFGPGEHTPVGIKLRSAAFSSFLLAASVSARKFSYVHVEDVALAAVHVMHTRGCDGQVFNITVNKPVSFDEGYKIYLSAMERKKLLLLRARIMELMADAARKVPFSSRLVSYLARKLGFTVWHPGHYNTYSSQKLLGTSFRYKWDNFEDVLMSCMLESDEPSKSGI